MRSVLAMLYLIGSVSVAVAGEPRWATCEVAGGLSFPSGPTDFTTNFSAGPHLSTGISYPNRSTISGLILLEWNSHALDRTNGSLTIFSVTANLKVNLGMEKSPTVPYVLAGMGVYRISTSDMTVSGGGGFAPLPPQDETALALQLGLGQSIPASPGLAVFMEARYLVGLTKGETTSSFPIRIGIRSR